MCMRLTGIGSQYLIAMRDGDGAFLDGARDYRLTLPADIPQSRFWSRDPLRPPDALHAPDRPAEARPRQPVGHGRDQRRRLDRPLHRSDRARGQGVDNWLQTVPGKGFFVILRLYNPLQPFFDKTWRPSEIEPAGSPPP